MQILSQGQWYELFEHVHELRCDFPHGTKCKLRPAKEFLTVTLHNWGVCLLLIIFSNSWINADRTRL